MWVTINSTCPVVGISLVSWSSEELESNPSLTQSSLPPLSCRIIVIVLYQCPRGDNAQPLQCGFPGLGWLPSFPSQPSLFRSLVFSLTCWNSPSEHCWPPKVNFSLNWTSCSVFGSPFDCAACLCQQQPSGHLAPPSSSFSPSSLLSSLIGVYSQISPTDSLSPPTIQTDHTFNWPLPEREHRHNGLSEAHRCSWAHGEEGMGLFRAV